ncbi:MAG: DNA primase [Candidatus Paceibacterota bacterium]
MNGSVQTIKDRLSIVDVISSYLSVEQAGRNYRARCPFHNEKTPSFFISPDRGSYYCFGCGAKGDIFSFVEHFEGTDFRGALKLLADKAGVTLENTSFSKDTRDEKERLYSIIEDATLFFESQFLANKEARAYLLGRGLTDATMRAFRIGFAPDAWRAVSDHLTKKGYSKKDIETVGLTKPSAKQADHSYDRFRSRIMFPICDSSGRVIAFSGRIFGKDDTEEAKYLNSPETPLFNKASVLYGIDKAKTAIRTRGYSIIVEGQMDLLLSHQAGFTNTVATSGTAFSDTTDNTQSKITNLGLIRRLSPNIIFAFDGDNAGIRATSRAAMIAFSLDMQVKTTCLPEGKDPADIIHESQDAWKEYIKTSVNLVSFHLDRICAETTDVRVRGRKIREIVFPFLSMVSSAIERSAYVHDIYLKTGIGEQAVIDDFRDYEKTHTSLEVKQHSSREVLNSSGLSRRSRLEERLFGIIFWNENGGEIQETQQALIDAFKVRIGTDVFMEIHERHVPNSATLCFEAEMWYGEKIATLGNDLEEILLNLEEEILHDKKRGLHPLDTDEKLVAHTNINKRIEEIKHHRSQK